MKVEKFHESLARCIDADGFFDCFYQKFMASEEIEAFFVDTDMARQKRALKVSFYMVTTFIAEPAEQWSDRYFEELRVRHEELGIRPRHYDMWLDALIEAVAQCDPRFDEEIEASWRLVMGTVIRAMVRDGDRSRTEV